MKDLFTKICTVILLSLVAVPIALAADNPMEFVGIEHNRHLDCLRQQQVNSTASAIDALVHRCGFDPGMPASEFHDRYGSLINAAEVSAALSGSWPHRDIFDDREFAYLVAMQHAMVSGGSIDEIDAMLSDIESDAVAELDRSTRNGQAVLAGLATARYSIRYWSGQAASGSIQARAVISVAMADAIGAALGTMIGGPIVGVGVGALFSWIAEQINKLINEL